jgi:hypothetical protein
MHKWAVASSKMDFDVSDSFNSAELNAVLWHAVKGPYAKLPISITVRRLRSAIMMMSRTRRRVATQMTMLVLPVAVSSMHL